MGEVFDIKRFALHDGPGIRCTAFLKGCPLQCIWCHNPEGRRPGLEVAYLPLQCIGCGACIGACKYGAIEENGSGIKIKREICRRCGACALVCPAGALLSKGYDIEALDLMRMFDKDRVFYESSNGGISLSGGDPLYQPGFSEEILRHAKARGYHTIIETCLHTSKDTLETLLELVDHWIVDLKIWDDARHKKLAGQSNKQILKNYAQLSTSGRPMLTRIPIIPGCTDSQQNITALGQYINSVNPQGDVELIFYNPLTEAKYKNYGVSYALSGVAPYSEKRKKQFYEIMRATGARLI